MVPYHKATRDSSKVVASEYKDCIGRGVFSELEIALHSGIPCFVLRKFWGFFYLRKIKGVKIHCSNSWSVYYGKVIV